MSSRNMIFFEEQDFKIDGLTLAEALKIDQENQKTGTDFVSEKKGNKRKGKKNCKGSNMSLAEALKIDQENIGTTSKTEGISHKTIYFDEDCETEMSLSRAAALLMSLNTLSSAEFASRF